MAPSPQAGWRERITRSGFFLGAVLFHLVLILLLASWVIWKAPPPPPTDEFGAVSVKLPPPAAQPPPAGAAAVNPQVEPDQVVVPVVTMPSAITTASSPFTVDTSTMLSQTLNRMSDQMAKGTGLDAAGGGNRSDGDGSGYGSSSGGEDGFVGTIYDLKQSPDGKPTDMAENASEVGAAMDPNWETSPATRSQLDLLRNFIKSWNPDLLQDYYKAPITLTATQLCIPVGPSENAPKAFKVEGTIHARRWIIIYHAKIVAPESGTYRFIGYGDDFLVVRIDDKNVLDASLDNYGEALEPEANGKDDVGAHGGDKSYTCGSWFEMEAGLSVDMQVLIGEGPGGESGFVLMIQKQGDDSTKGDYPVFQLHDSPVPDANTLVPPSKKKMLFQVSS
jgi:hypothetical protein